MHQLLYPDRNSIRVYIKFLVNMFELLSNWIITLSIMKSMFDNLKTHKTWINYISHTESPDQILKQNYDATVYHSAIIFLILLCMWFRCTSESVLQYYKLLNFVVLLFSMLYERVCEYVLHTRNPFQMTITYIWHCVSGS